MMCAGEVRDRPRNFPWLHVGNDMPPILLFITKKVWNGDYPWVSFINAKYCFIPHFLDAQKMLAGLEPKNGEIKPKSRRRWGLVSRSTKDSDDWADLDDLDFSPSLTRIDLKNKKRQSEETLCRQVCSSAL